MKINKLPPIEVLRARLNYDPSTGELTWKTHRFRSRVNKPVGKLSTKGYVQVRLDGILYAAHRIVWKLHHEVDPPHGAVIDHINRVRTDNRLENLRLVTLSENNLNTSGRSIYGLPAGVSPHGKKFRARVKWKGKCIHIGSFNSVEEAQAARESWVREQSKP